jgi:hypothetical protein
MASSTIMWLDEANKTAEFEPVGTHPDYSAVPPSAPSTSCSVTSTPSHPGVNGRAAHVPHAAHLRSVTHTVAI